MNLTNNFYSLPVITLVAFGLANSSFADRNYEFNVKYDQVVSHAHDLEYIARDLKNTFRDQFRSSRLSGKMIGKTNKIRNRARSLHRHGVSRGNCNWQNEIQQLNVLVRGLRGLVDEAVHLSRTGYERPLCRNAVRAVYKLLGKAEWHVAGLEKALYQVNRPVFNRPVYPQPNNCFPGFGNNIGPNDFINKYYNSRRSVFATSSSFEPRPINNTGIRNGLEVNRIGLAVNVGGFKFYVNK